ncbi:unnamed protein product, partial [Heterotrigona itama]
LFSLLNLFLMPRFNELQLDCTEVVWTSENCSTRFDKRWKLFLDFYISWTNRILISPLSLLIKDRYGIWRSEIS